MALSKCCSIIINIIIIICAQIHEHMNLGFLRVEYVEAFIMSRILILVLVNQ